MFYVSTSLTTLAKHGLQKNECNEQSSTGVHRVRIKVTLDSSSSAIHNHDIHANSHKHTCFIEVK